MQRHLREQINLCSCCLLGFSLGGIGIGLSQPYTCNIMLWIAQKGDILVPWGVWEGKSYMAPGYTSNQSFIHPLPHLMSALSFPQARSYRLLEGFDYADVG